MNTNKTYCDPMRRFTPAERWKLRIGYLLYQFLYHLFLPFLVLLLLRRARKEPLYAKHMHQRFGFLKPTTTGRVFIFAASLGETRAATPVIRRLLDSGETILLTHSSAAGLAEGQRAFGPEISTGRIVSAYVPTDLFWALALFYRRHRPKIGLVVEAELWPAMLREAARLDLPMFQINGNYTERGYNRDKCKLWGVRLLFWRFYQLILTKSQERAARYIAAGVPQEAVKLVGELKFDQAIKENQVTAARQLLNAVPPERPVFEISSSIEDEETQLIKVLERLKSQLSPMPRIVWIPRSPQRFDAVAEQLTAAGFRASKRSDVLDQNLKPAAFTEWPDVLIGNSIGEMDFYYSLADIVFVGATLAPMGGHNIIEPLALQKPVMTGPSIHGILYPAIEAIEAGALKMYNSEKEMASDLIDLFQNVEKMIAFQNATQGFNALHKGAADRTVAVLRPYLESQ